MIVKCDGLVNGVFLDRYGKHGQQMNEAGVPTCSIPLRIEDAPVNTVSYALVVEDKDAYPISGGFVWIHWLAANITRQELFENESQKANDFIQGVNSWTSIQGGQQSLELSSFYGGMCPPDKAHLYEVHVFALDQELALSNGFLLNELYHEMNGHILAQYTLKGYYPHEKVCHD